MKDDGSFYVLFEKEYKRYISDIISSRRLAFEILSCAFAEKDPDEWEEYFAIICELVATLYRFEEALEKACLKGTWVEAQKYWIIDEISAAPIALFLESQRLCKKDLLKYNISLSIN